MILWFYFNYKNIYFLLTTSIIYLCLEQPLFFDFSGPKLYIHCLSRPWKLHPENILKSIHFKISFKIVVFFNLTSADFILKSTTILKIKILEVKFYGAKITETKRMGSKFSGLSFMGLKFIDFDFTSWKFRGSKFFWSKLKVSRSWNKIVMSKLLPKTNEQICFLSWKVVTY